MNPIVPILFAATLLLIALVLLAGGVVAWMHRRRQCSEQSLRQQYLRIVLLALAAGDAAGAHVPLIRRIGSRRILAQTLVMLVSATYGLDVPSLRRMVASASLDRWLLRQIRFSQGYRRASWLFQLSHLPADSSVVAATQRYLQSSHRAVRFAALLVQLSADPSLALRMAANHADLFSPCEIAEIMAMLRRGMLPLAYEPLISSPSANLRLLGLAIVRQFGIEEAEPWLLRIAAADHDVELAREALYTLSNLHLQITQPIVRRRVDALPPADRKALLRYMAAAGYSAAALRRLFGELQHAYGEGLVRSYKRMLV